MKNKRLQLNSWPAHIKPFILSLIFYGVSAGTTLFHQSLAPHYVYLAYSFRRGLSYLDPLPPTTYDLLAFQGRWYVAGSPSPALLLLPWVTLKGVAVSDIFFGVVIGAINVALVSRLLAGLSKDDAFNRLQNETIRRWITILFAAGTAHWYIASLGSVWFNAQVVAVMFMLLYVHNVLTNGRTWLAGGWLALAALARPTTLFAASFFLVFQLMKRPKPKAFFSKIIPFGLVLTGGLAALLFFNWMRFGSALDFGYGYVQGAANITETFAQHGGFNIRFLPCNLYISMAGLPDIQGQFSPLALTFCPHLVTDPNLPVSNPWLAPNPLGMSLFLTTPAFFILLRARFKTAVTIGAWIGLLSILVPLWLYHNTGSLQFGYRYILDSTPFWLILIAAGAQKHFGRLERGLIMFSIIINFGGMIWMFKAFTGMDWISMW